jgi:RimJ/RimL family protein N-acetyltransferase
MIVPSVRLTPISREHAAAMFEWMLDAEVSQNLGVRGEPSLERTLAWIDNSITNPNVRAFAILDSDSTHVGNVVLDQIDDRTRSARLSIYLGRASDRGRGLGSSALMSALTIAFTELQLNKVWLIVHVENQRALAAYRKVGFREEGVLRQEFSLGNRRVDAVRMGILATEFTAARGIQHAA